MSFIGGIFTNRIKSHAANTSAEVPALYDLHCHLLPYADDGANDMEEAQMLLRQEYLQGVRSIVLTTHWKENFFNTTALKVQMYYRELKQWLQEEEDLSGLTLLQSREYFADERLSNLLMGYEEGRKEILYEGISYAPEEELLPFGEKKCILLEFSTRREQRTEMFFFINKVADLGFTPVLAHVERYPVIQNDPEFLKELRKTGAVIQVNADSLIGKEDKAFRELAHYILDREYADLIASDAHHQEVRKPNLAECYRYITRKYDDSYAKLLLHTNPYHLLHK